MGKLPEGLVVIWNGPHDLKKLKDDIAALEEAIDQGYELAEDPWDEDFDWDCPAQ